MKIKRFTAKTMREGMEAVRTTLGMDAVLLSTKSFDDGVEIVAAMDYDENLMLPSLPESAAQALPSDFLLERNTMHAAPSYDSYSPMGTDSLDLANIKAQLEQLSALIRTHKTPVLPSSPPEEPSISIFEGDLLKHSGLLAFVGSTGVGKTTTLAKFAAHYVLHNNPRSLGIISLDTYRIGAREQLQTYGHLIGVPVYVVDSPDKLNRTLAKLSDKQLILIDTAGMGQNDTRLLNQLNVLYDTQQTVTCALVIPATSTGAVVEQIIDRFSVLNCKACILTKVDECVNLSEALRAVNNKKMPIAYFSQGQRVPEDLTRASTQSLLDAMTLLAPSEKAHESPLITTINRFPSSPEVHEPHLIGNVVTHHSVHDYV